MAYSRNGEGVTAKILRVCGIPRNRWDGTQPSRLEVRILILEYWQRTGLITTDEKFIRSVQEIFKQYDRARAAATK